MIIHGPGDKPLLHFQERDGWYLISDGIDRVAVSANDMYWILKNHLDRSLAWEKQIMEAKKKLPFLIRAEKEGAKRRGPRGPRRSFRYVNRTKKQYWKKP